MKRVLFSLAILALLSMIVTGCAKQSQTLTPQKEGRFAGAPAWVNRPTMEGGRCARGSYPLGTEGTYFAEEQAKLMARNELARQIKVKVKNMVKHFTEITGMSEDKAVDRVATQVSKQVTSLLLQGSVCFETWESPDNEIFVLVCVDPTLVNVKSSVKNSTLTSFKNNKALWQKFQAKKAYDELDKEIEKEFRDFEKHE